MSRFGKRVEKVDIHHGRQKKDVLCDQGIALAVILGPVLSNNIYSFHLPYQSLFHEKIEAGGIGPSHLALRVVKIQHMTVDE